MAKQGAQSGGGHGVSTMAAFERNKQSVRVGQRSFQMQVVFEDLESVAGQRQEALLTSLAEDVETSFGEGQVQQLELEDFAGAQAIEQHQGHDGQVAEGAEAFPENSHLLGGQGHDHTARLAQSQLASDLRLPTAEAERGARGIPALKVRLPRNLLSTMEAIEAAHHAQAVIDGLRRG